jgi:hypothetical protein
MHTKLLLREAELVEQGWCRETAARDVGGRKVRSTSPAAASWCLVGALDRALHELLNLEVYDLLGLEPDAYDKTACPAGVLSELRRPLQLLIGRVPVAAWNDWVCPNQDEAVRLLLDAADLVNPFGERRGGDELNHD